MWKKEKLFGEQGEQSRVGGLKGTSMCVCGDVVNIQYTLCEKSLGYTVSYAINTCNENLNL